MVKSRKTSTLERILSSLLVLFIAMFSASPLLRTSISTINQQGQTEHVTPENLTTWVFEDGTFIPMAKLQGEKSYSIVTDHLGTPVESYDEEGEKVWSRELNIYGETRKEFGVENFIPFKYQGQYYDEETELAYNRFRYYDSSAGVYISQDPIRLEGGYSFYSYVHDSNIFIDPLGWIEVIRTMCEGEANQTVSNRGLVRGQNNSRGAKWVSVGQDYDTAKASQHKVVFDMDDSADDFLKSDNLDYEDMVGGEKNNTRKILTKSNEKGAYGVGVDKLDDFNSKIKKITVYKKDKGRWKKIKSVSCG